MLVHPETDAAPIRVGTVTDQPITPDMPRPNQTLLVALRLRLQLAPPVRRPAG